MSRASRRGSGPGVEIELYVLGRTELRVEGEIAAAVLAQPKRLALFAYLCLARPRGAHQRDTLLPIFWPESPDTQARQSLNQSVAFLRRALGGDAIVSRGRHALEVPPDSLRCDVLDFERAVDEGRLGAALRSYQGDLLPGLNVAGSRYFERWLDEERERLRRQALVAARRRVDQLAGEDRLDEAIECCTWARAVDPLGSELAVAMFDLLAHRGDEHRLLAAYRDYEERLAEELGLAPPPAAETAFHEARETARGRGRKVAVSSAAKAPADPRDGPAEEGESVVVELAATSAADAHAGPATGRRMGRGIGRDIGRAVVVAVVAVSLGAAAYLTQARSGTPDVSLDSRKILVAPPSVIGAGSERTWVAAATVEWVARELARGGFVRVIAPGVAGLPAARSGEASDPTPLQRAFDSGAGLVLTTSLQPGRRERVIEAALLETGTARVLASIGPIVIDPAAPARALRTFGERVTAAVAVAVDPTLGEWTTTVSAPPDLDAYKTFTEGLDALAEQRPIDAAERFLAAAHRSTGFITAKIWAVRALVEAHRHQSADSIARSLADLRPRLSGWDRATFDYYAAYLWGTWEEAYHAARELVEIAPDVDWRHQLAAAARVSGRLTEARAILEGLRDEEGWIREWPYRWRSLAFTLHELGEFEEELALAEEWQDHTPTLSERTAIGALAALGRVDQMGQRLDGLLARLEDPDARARSLGFVTEELTAHGHDSRIFRARWLEAVLSDSISGGDDFRGIAMRAEALLAVAEYDAAYALVAPLGVQPPGADAEMRVALLHGIAAARLGKEDEARRIAERFRDDTPLGQGHITMHGARILAALGDREAATERLALAIEQGFGRYPWLHLVPEFLPLRTYGPFRQLMRPES